MTVGGPDWTSRSATAKHRLFPRRNGFDFLRRASGTCLSQSGVLSVFLPVTIGTAPWNLQEEAQLAGDEVIMDGVRVDPVARMRHDRIVCRIRLVQIIIERISN